MMSFSRILVCGLFLLVLCAAGIDGLYAQNMAKDKGISLIVRGDDIGSCHAANVACIRAYKEGIVRSTEVMVPCSWFPEAVKMLNENPGLDVGIHLVLTSEWDNYKWRPSTYAPSLTDKDGYFYPTIWPRRNAPAGTALKNADWKIEEIEKELRAQIELGKQKIPQVSHLSFHMGSNSWDPKVKELCDKLAREYGLYVMTPETGPARDGQAHVRGMGGFGNAKTADERIEKFVKSLEGLKPGTYLFIEHPGLNTPEMRAIGHPGYEDVAQDRDAVTKVFTSEKVKSVIKRLRIKLISYADQKKAAEK
jgi:predicted glycoside hydrolase/deacetylase ChbG (UPF0249 family)